MWMYSRWKHWKECFDCKLLFFFFPLLPGIWVSWARKYLPEKRNRKANRWNETLEWSVEGSWKDLSTIALHHELCDHTKAWCTCQLPTKMSALLNHLSVWRVKVPLTGAFKNCRMCSSPIEEGWTRPQLYSTMKCYTLLNLRKTPVWKKRQFEQQLLTW